MSLHRRTTRRDGEIFGGNTKYTPGSPAGRKTDPTSLHADKHCQWKAVQSSECQLYALL